ncbi:molecular chaperone [Serratia marcescens]|nr:molecular chaperone [Serratia marcescens]
MLRILFISLLMAAQSGWAAGFGINATRLIYPQGAGSIAAELRNTHSDEPLLVQVGVSDSPEVRARGTFAVTPPLFRLEPQSVNQIRIAQVGSELPADRESVFYFHATAIAASQMAAKAQSQGDALARARFGVGSVIKLFYRPNGLRGSSADAQKGLQFSRTASGLRVTNPSAYYVSFAGLQVEGKSLPLNTPAELMLAPGGSHTWPTGLAAGSKVTWQTINDNGGHNAHSVALP